MTTVGARTGAAAEVGSRGVRVEAEGLTRRLADGRAVLHDVTLRFEPGELVAIIGGSGAGKSTLLDALSGVRPAQEGEVHFDGLDVYREAARVRQHLGYVPQDDIVHGELPVARTLHYSAALRLGDLDAAARSERVADAMDELGLSERADVAVSALSGGQRKRVSIAVELLSRPHVFFLDEPTSGLDPATGIDLLRSLRQLSEEGSTVVFTTHAVTDVETCDRVVVLAGGGHLAFSGTVADALTHFGVSDVADIYEVLATSDPEALAERAGQVADDGEPLAVLDEREWELGRRVGPVRQWWALTRRTGETIVRNRLTLAILLGSPAMVVAMFAVLFRPGAFDFDDPSPSATVMIIFWIAFGGFFFGLTYGLLQICTESAIVRRERLAGLRLGSYLLSKVAVLLPFLLFVDVLMLGVLRGLDRLPAMAGGTFLVLVVTLALDATAALALGLLASAGVANPSQATLALPMLCFPAVLFSGAILPVPVMATAGQVISALMPDRWAFESVGRSLGLRELFSEGGSPLGPPLLETYGDTGTWSTATYWAILAAFVAVFLAATWVVLVRRCRVR